MSPSIEEMQQMALDSGFCLMTSDECEPKPAQLAAFRDRIVASLCADAKPVAETFFDGLLYSASTVAAIRAQPEPKA